MKPFNVIIFDPNRRIFEAYDVMPYFVRVYKELKSNKPKTFEEFKDFVTRKGMYMYWSRCQYEIILRDWPCQQNAEKIDIWWQIKMNLETLVNLLMDNINTRKTTNKNLN